MTDNGNRNNPGCLGQLAYCIGWFELGTAILGLTIYAVIFLFTGIESLIAGGFEEFVAIYFSKYVSLKYAAPLTAGIFLAAFFIRYFQVKNRPNPVASYLLTLFVACFFTLVIILAVNLFLEL